jgi:hypothetical protein
MELVLAVIGLLEKLFGAAKALLEREGRPKQPWETTAPERGRASELATPTPL